MQEGERMNYEDQNGYYPMNDPEYPHSTEPTPMSHRQKGRRGGGWVAVALVALLAVALFVTVSYLTRHIGVNLNKTEHGISISVGTRRPQPESEQALPQSSPQPSVPAENAAPSQPSNAVGSGQTLQLSQSRPGKETVPDESGDALSLQQIYKKMIGSVVSITTATQKGTASGTGIIMSADGYVITNEHVIDGAYEILVFTSDEQNFRAEIVGSDKISDLAVLKVEADDLTPAEFGDSTLLRVGDSVVAIGDPLGVQLRGTMTDGIISAINRDLTVDDRKMTLIQTNAALNNGNSGGPLINCYGQVIGINTVKMSSYVSASASVEGIGFAIPIAVAKPIVDELIENGFVSGRPAIGISGETLPRSLRMYYQLPDGIYIRAVTEGSGAAEKGIAEGDIITAINGTPVSSIDELNTVKNQFAAGDTVTLTVYRSGQYYDVDVRLVDQVTGK